MKKIILSILVITSLISCQSQNIKKTQVVENAPEISNISVAELVRVLDDCYENQVCKAQMDAELPQWLLENSYINENEPALTDESDNEKLPKNVTIDNSDQITKVNLSSNFMNNELIRGALNEWLTWKRPQLINTWQYYQYLREDMLPAFKQYGIDEALILAIMAQESGGKVHSRSRVGAGGLFQLMPATAKRMGLHGKIGAYDLRFNPQKSAIAAAKYIQEQSLLYDNDEAKILAAYNSGENRFRRLNKKYKNKSLWDKDFYYDLPRETRHYIPVVLAAMLIFQDPNKFNVKFDSLDVLPITVTLARKSSLSALAVCLGQEQRVDGWFRVLRNMNSGIKADKTIAAYTTIKIPKILEDTFEKNCQNDELMQLADSFHEADFKGNTGLFNYRVKQGDSLGKIARKFRCTSRKEIARLNQIRAPRYLIRAGKYLKIPQC